MAIPFTYASITTPQQFNIRPSYSIGGISIAAGSLILTGISYENLLKLVIGMQVSIPLVGVREIDSIDYINETVTVTGTAITTSFPMTCEFYQDILNGNYLTTKLIPLTGQQMHDNFFYLSEGVYSNQSRIITLESLPQTSSQKSIGYLEYNGYLEKEAAFYGGTQLYNLAENPLDVSAITVSHSLELAVNERIQEPVEDSDFFIIETGIYGVSFGSVTNYCNWLNPYLVNNGGSFHFRSIAVTDGNFIKGIYTYDDTSWNTNRPGFFIQFDDSSDDLIYKIEFQTKPSNLTSLRDAINSKLGTLTTKVEAEIYTNVDNFIQLTGKNNRASGCSRIRLIEFSGGNFIRDVLNINITQIPYLNGEIYDFSEMLEFVPDGTKVALQGKGTGFHLALRDNATNGILSRSGFTSFGNNDIYERWHSMNPTHTNYQLNFDGIFNASQVKTIDLIASSNFTVAGNTSITGNLSVTGTSALAGIVTISNITESTTKDNGALIVEGGVGIENRLNVGGALAVTGASTLTGALTVNNLTDSSTISSGAIITTGGAGIAKNLYVGVNANIAGTLTVSSTVTFGASAPVIINNGTNSTSQETGALKVSGGIGVGGNVQATAFMVGSSRIIKTNIYESTLNALELINDILVVNYNYKTDLTVPKIGFIAEDTDTLLSTSLHNSMDITNCIGILLKSVQELNAKIESIRM